MADQVRKDAKVRALELNPDSPPSVIDWWLNRQGELDRPGHGALGTSLRPYQLTGPFPSWQWLSADVMPGLWRHFADSRGKLKELGAAAEEDNDGSAVKHLRELTWRTGNGPLQFVSPLNVDTGFDTGSRKTVLGDACELFDIYYPFPNREEHARD